MRAADRERLIARTQEEQEQQWPAEILFTGSEDVLACAGGNLKLSGFALGGHGGGSVEDRVLTFRVRKALFDARPGNADTFQWRRANEEAWRETVRAATLADSGGGDDSYIITTEHVAKS